MFILYLFIYCNIVTVSAVINRHTGSMIRTQRSTTEPTAISTTQAIPRLSRDELLATLRNDNNGVLLDFPESGQATSNPDRCTESTTQTLSIGEFAANFKETWLEKDCIWEYEMLLSIILPHECEPVEINFQSFVNMLHLHGIQHIKFDWIKSSHPRCCDFILTQRSVNGKPKTIDMHNDELDSARCNTRDRKNGILDITEEEPILSIKLDPKALLPSFPDEPYHPKIHEQFPYTIQFVLQLGVQGTGELARYTEYFHPEDVESDCIGFSKQSNKKLLNQAALSIDTSRFAGSCQVTQIFTLLHNRGTSALRYPYAIHMDNKRVELDYVHFPFTQLLAHDNPEEIQSFNFAVPKGGSPIRVLGVRIPMRSKAEVDKIRQGTDMEYYDMTLAWMVPSLSVYGSEREIKNRPIKVTSQQKDTCRNLAVVNAELTNEYPWFRLALMGSSTNRTAPITIQIGVEFNGTKKTQDDDSKDHTTIDHSQSKSTNMMMNEMYCIFFGIFLTYFQL